MIDAGSRRFQREHDTRDVGQLTGED